MQDLLLKENWLNCFKYFSFRFKTCEVKRIYYKDSIYEGQTIIRESDNQRIKHGVGCFFTNKGIFYYGQFKNDELHGDGNIITEDGSFFRGNFKQGRFKGVGLFVKPNSDIYILKFKNGVLYSKVTFFPATGNEGFLLQYHKNKLQKVIKRYTLGSKDSCKAKFKVVRSLFENSQLNEILYTATDVQKIIKKADSEKTKFVGSHLLNKDYFFCGVFGTKLGFEGLGLVLNFTNKKIRVGDWANQLINGCGFIIEGKYQFTGNFQQNNLTGKVIVKNLHNKDCKVCDYENGRFKKALHDKGTDYEIFKIEGENDIKRLKYPINHDKIENRDFRYSKLIYLGFNINELDLSISGLEEFIIERQGDIAESLLNFNFAAIEPKKKKQKKSIDKAKKDSVREYGEVELKGTCNFIKQSSRRLQSRRKRNNKLSMSMNKVDLGLQGITDKKTKIYFIHTH